MSDWEWGDVASDVQKKEKRKYARDVHPKKCHRWTDGISDPILRLSLDLSKNVVRPTLSKLLFTKYQKTTPESARDASTSMQLFLQKNVYRTNIDSLNWHIDSRKKRKSTPNTTIKSDFESSAGTDELSKHVKLLSTDTGSTASDSGVSELSLKPTGEANFLNKTLCMLKPVHAVEPLWSYGFDIKLVEQMENVYELENLSKENFVSSEDLTLNNVAEEVTQFMNKLVLNQLVEHPNNHFIKNVVLGYLEKKDYVWVKDFLDVHMEDRMFAVFWELTVKQQAANMDEIDNLDEGILQECLAHYLLIDPDVIANTGRKVHLHQFNDIEKPLLGQNCYPDVYYKLSKMAKLFGTSLISLGESAAQVFLAMELKTSTYSSPVRTFMETLNKIHGTNVTMVNIGIKLLWQVTEQCFGLMMKAKYSTSGRTKILHSSLIVVQNKVRALVMSVDVSKYEKLLELQKAEDTITWLFKSILDNDNLWCKMYLDTKEYWLTDIMKVAKYNFINFCRSV